MNTIHRTALHIVTRLRSHEHLRLAVMLTRGCIRCFDVSSEDISGLGRHFRLIGVYDATIDTDTLADDIQYVMQQVKAETA